MKTLSESSREKLRTGNVLDLTVGEKAFLIEQVHLVKHLEGELERYEKAIKITMGNTHDDDTHEFLNRVLQGKENDAPRYRLHGKL